ncbi:MAG: hypothetical protein JO265_16075 [Acidimicrobiia bacterium]|nr:hypothetical protein [Acidimicrobiia bacterium]
MRAKTVRVLAAALLLGLAGGTVTLAGGPGSQARAADAAVDPGPTPRAQCGPGSKPETAEQGRVPAADFHNGRAAQGYTCNLELIGRQGGNAGFRVYRYVDSAGHECGFYDSGPLFPFQLLLTPGKTPGVMVLDMSDPTHPKLTDTLTTPAMISPHESLSLNVKRGLLAADMGNALTLPGWVDIYDVTHDCLHPTLKSSTPFGIFGHEGTFSPDGNTFWVSSTAGHTITALDVSNPSVPVPIWLGIQWVAHGMNVSDDGNRLYMADIADAGPNAGLTILDVSQIQQRKTNPQVRVVSHLSWPEVSIPQTAIPVSIGGHPYLVEVDEFSRLNYPKGPLDRSAPVGAARIIDIADDTHPRVVSNLRLQVHMPANEEGPEQHDPGGTPVIGYAAHYCAVPSRVDPGIVACGFLSSGLRVFDIRDPYHPRELAYANFPVTANRGPTPPAWAASAPAFVPERGEIWYSDGFSGFYAVRFLNGVWPFRAAAAGTARSTAVLGSSTVRAAPAPPAPPASPATSATPAAELAVTGGSAPVGIAGGALLVGLLLLLLRRRAAAAHI